MAKYTTPTLVTKTPIDNVWTIGCKDPMAINYDKNANSACSNCCQYESPQAIMGCMDPMASNYNDLASVDCVTCCSYEQVNPSSPWSDLPIFTETTSKYQVDVNSAVCISNTSYENTWLNDNQLGYGNGYLKYQEDLNQITQGDYVPNYEYGTMDRIWSAFEVILQKNINARVFINNFSLTPWIIPTNIVSGWGYPFPNPDVDRFKTDCQSVNGFLFTYDTRNGSTDVSDNFHTCLCYQETPPITPTTGTTTDDGCPKLVEEVRTVTIKGNTTTTIITNGLTTTTIVDDSITTTTTVETHGCLGFDGSVNVTTTTSCPKIPDGSVDIVSDFITTDGGTEYITYAKNVGQECCSNVSLKSNMPGEWMWDGSRCILNTKEDSQINTDNTILTISETPIITDGCEDVVITAYIYFGDPSNKCNGGFRIDDTYGGELPQGVLNALQSGPTTATDISTFSNDTWTSNFTPQSYDKPITQKTNNCCYDITRPIIGRLILQDVNTNNTIDTDVTYVDTYTSVQPDFTDFNNTNGGFNRWVKLTTTANISSLEQFNLAIEFTDGLFKCCDYDIYFDDISVNCDKILTKETYNTEKCPGFELRRVIDNKKSWVYNPGTEDTSSNVYDNIVRSYGTDGLIQGYGDINRTFAPSADAELNYRDTDYYGFHNVMEKHSNLVLNSKEVVLQFNMCADYDCTINPQFLIDDDGGYVLDDDGGRIIVGSSAPMPNLLQLEQFKKTFQGFWVQFMEQFIPATTIFVAGEKWCNPIVCEEKVVCDYMMDVSLTDGILSPSPITINVTEDENLIDNNTNSTPTTINQQSGDAGGTDSTGVSVTTYDAPIGQPITVGNTSLYTLDILDPDLGVRVHTRNLLT